MGRMTCREFIEDFLADYMDGTLSPEVVADLERHLTLCPPCVAYMNTYAKTRRLIHSQAAQAMPDEMQLILRKFLQDRLPRQG